MRVERDQFVAHKQVHLLLRLLLSPAAPLCTVVLLPEGLDFRQETFVEFDGLLLGVALPQIKHFVEVPVLLDVEHCGVDVGFRREVDELVVDSEVLLVAFSLVPAQGRIQLVNGLHSVLFGEEGRRESLLDDSTVNYLLAGALPAGQIDLNTDELVHYFLF